MATSYISSLLKFSPQAENMRLIMGGHIFLPILTSLLFTSGATQAATQQQIDAALAPVKSAATLEATLSQPSAFDALGDELPAFIASIQFSQAGEATFDNTLLQSNLSATEVYQAKDRTVIYFLLQNR
jgi:hypothetical protein